MISVVIPAHNEERVIARGLAALVEGAGAGELEIIVVCNGCSDGTAEAARRIGGPVTVLETDTLRKANALRMGDAAARGFPRFYIDADVVVTRESLHRMVRRLERGDVMAVSPRIVWNLAGATWAVRAFYDIDRRLPSHGETIGGSGVYALSQAGRERIGGFPIVTADDAFVRRSFAVHERAMVGDASSVVTPPKTLAGVTAIKTRSHFGNYELSRLYPALGLNVGAGNRPALIGLAIRPWLWAKLAVYGYVKVAARLAAKRRIRSGKQLTWERDETSRAATHDPRSTRGGGSST